MKRKHIGSSFQDFLDKTLTPEDKEEVEYYGRKPMKLRNTSDWISCETEGYPPTRFFGVVLGEVSFLKDKV